MISLRKVFGVRTHDESQQDIDANVDYTANPERSPQVQKSDAFESEDKSEEDAADVTACSNYASNDLKTASAMNRSR